MPNCSRLVSHLSEVKNPIPFFSIAGPAAWQIYQIRNTTTRMVSQAKPNVTPRTQRSKKSCEGLGSRAIGGSCCSMASRASLRADRLDGRPHLGHDLLRQRDVTEIRTDFLPVGQAILEEF